jgi:CubicO group peptidase (beta-lactamase class C family)
MVMRVSGLSLDDYFKKHIFEPLGVKNVTFFPTKEMKKNLAYMHQRRPDGKLELIDQPNHRALVVETPEEIKATFNAGGAGCFAQPSEYCKIIAMFLNDGTSPTTGKQILKKETVDHMFSNQIPEFPDYGRQGIPAAKPLLTNQLPALYPQEGPQGWGLTFFSHLSDGLTGRAKGTGWWAGGFPLSRENFLGDK